MFLAIHYPKLRNNEFIEFIELLCKIINSNDPEVLKIKAQYDDITALLATLSVLFKPDLASAITQELEEIDARRDTAITGLEMQIKSFTYSIEPAKREASNLLSQSLATYGSGISRMNYQAESSTIRSIIQKWEADAELTAALTTLGLIAWVAELKAANNLFEERYLDRLKDDANNPEEKTFELRKEIILSYRTLLAHLQAHATISTDNSYDTVVQQINQLIEQYNKLVAARGSNKEEEEVISQD
jgi:hypothetical protein